MCLLMNTGVLVWLGDSALVSFMCLLMNTGVLVWLGDSALVSFNIVVLCRTVSIGRASTE